MVEVIGEHESWPNYALTRTHRRSARLLFSLEDGAKGSCGGRSVIEYEGHFRKTNRKEQGWSRTSTRAL